MKTPKLLIVNFLLLLLLPVAGHAQCNSKIRVVEKGITPSGSGYVKVSVDSDSRYEVDLVMEGATVSKEISLKKTQSSGTQTFLFEDLKADKRYAIVVNFETEQRPVCKQKRTDYIEFTK